MSTHYKEDSYVRCPYYRKEAPVEIKCNGLCGTHTIQCFESRQEKEQYKDDFCIGFFWNCPCYIGLEQDGK